MSAYWRGKKKLNRRVGKVAKINNEERIFAEPKGHSFTERIKWESK